jgi:hypothetical protein
VPLFLAGAAFLGAGWLFLAPDRVARQAFPPGSAFSKRGDGLSLAYGYLRARAGGASRRRVATLHRPLDLRSVEPDAVVFRVRPALELAGLESAEAEGLPARPRALPRLLAPGEEEWLASGGRLVVALAERYGPLRVRGGQTVGSRTAPRKVFPLWPGVRRLAPPVRRTLVAGTFPFAHAVFLLGGRVREQPLVSRLAVGRGELVVLACPEVLENAHLGLADHLRLLDALAGSGRPVYLDERAHGLGESAGTLGMLLRWRLGPALALVALAGLAVLWRGRARLGPPEPEPPECRREAVDLVDSLAQLYARALSRREAIAMYRRALESAVGLRTGLRGAALAARVRDLAGEEPAPAAPGTGAGDLKPWQFTQALERLNRGFEGVEHG